MENMDNNPELRVHKSECSKLVGQLLSQLSELDSEDEGPHTSCTSQIDATPWQAGFNKYLNMSFELGTMTIVKFWGLHASQYLVWASLARDYLLIMALSMSSERAFSSAGITISKHRNCLKQDIVEALQFLKCTMQKDLLFQEVEMMQAELKKREKDGSVAEKGWDEFLDDDALLSDVGENDGDVDMGS
ncbi:hypothetical protein AX16_001266 [Volvariella volvacea WC 439]|nr:hypothetical protein AX16_001266 [Volvariella volvacea WC 439]